MLIMPSFKSLIVDQFQVSYLKAKRSTSRYSQKSHTEILNEACDCFFHIVEQKLRSKIAKGFMLAVKTGRTTKSQIY